MIIVAYFIVIFVGFLIELMLPVEVFAASKSVKSTGSWSVVKTLSNSGDSTFGGINYQKTYDSSTGVTCYLASAKASSVAISCLKTD